LAMTRDWISVVFWFQVAGLLVSFRVAHLDSNYHSNPALVETKNPDAVAVRSLLKYIEYEQENLKHGRTQDDSNIDKGYADHAVWKRPTSIRV
jgi:hypothetical protein